MRMAACGRKGEALVQSAISVAAAVFAPLVSEGNDL